jgi:hypothetical protein
MAMLVLVLGRPLQLSQAGEPAVFVHPGVLHSRADLDRMKTMVARGTQPWHSAFECLQRHTQSQSDWRLRGPFPSVSRGPRDSRHISEMDQDANAAYQNALMWSITSKEAHARKAVEILNAWSATLTEIVGKDKELGASLGGFKFVNAAEIIARTYPAWQPGDRARCRRMFRTVFFPVVKDAAPFANGNWGAGCIKMTMGIGVFCDDRAIFDRGVDYFYHGTGNASLTHYVINAAGQCQESGRDQQHAQLGLGHLAEVCEIAWNQGLDLYGAADNRLLRGFEYTAQYNLGFDVPFVAHRDTAGKYAWKVIAPDGRGGLRPIYEMVFNHYAKRCRLVAPFTRQAAEKIRPEGAAQDADHPGFGTLLWTQSAADDQGTRSSRAAE